MKGDIVLNILTKQAYDLQEPWTPQISLKNIEAFLVIISHFYEWRLQAHLNSKFRDDMLPLLFCRDTRWRFIEAVQLFETSLHPSASPPSPLALCSSLEKSEDTELQTFSLKLESAANPVNEQKRLEFWISCVKKFSEQLRQISLYSDEKKSNSKNSFFESPQPHPHQNRQGGASLKLKCFTCPNFHLSKRGRPSQYLGLCDVFKNQSLHKQKDLLKTHKMCQICLGPRSSCRNESDTSVCQKQVIFNMKCQQCGDPKHHAIMCPQKTSYYQSEFQSDSQRGRGGSHRGRGAGRGGRSRGRGARQQNDRRPQSQSQGRQDAQSFNTQSSHPQPPNSASSFPNSGSSPSPLNASSANSKSYSENQRSPQGQLLHNSQSQQSNNVGQKQLTYDISNSNFMSQPNPDILRQRFNIPANMTVNTYYVGDDGDDIINCFFI